MVVQPGPSLAPPWPAPYPFAMPARSRPTARLLTPVGWAGLAALLLLVAGLVAAAMAAAQA